LRRRAEQVVRRQVDAAISEQCSQGGGSVGDFIRVNHAVVIGVKGEKDGRLGAKPGGAAPAARPGLCARAWPAGSGSARWLRDGHPGGRAERQHGQTCFCHDLHILLPFFCLI